MPGSVSVSASSPAGPSSSQRPRRSRIFRVRRQVSQAMSVTSSSVGGGSSTNSRGPPGSRRTKTPSVTSEWKCTLRARWPETLWMAVTAPGWANFAEVRPRSRFAFLRSQRNTDFTNASTTAPQRAPSWASRYRSGCGRLRPRSSRTGRCQDGRVPEDPLDEVGCSLVHASPEARRAPSPSTTRECHQTVEAALPAVDPGEPVGEDPAAEELLELPLHMARDGPIRFLREREEGRVVLLHHPVEVGVLGFPATVRSSQGGAGAAAGLHPAGVACKSWMPGRALVTPEGGRTDGVGAEVAFGRPERRFSSGSGAPASALGWLGRLRRSG